MQKNIEKVRSTAVLVVASTIVIIGAVVGAGIIMKQAPIAGVGRSGSGTKETIVPQHEVLGEQDSRQAAGCGI